MVRGILPIGRIVLPVGRMVLPMEKVSGNVGPMERRVCRGSARGVRRAGTLCPISRLQTTSDAAGNDPAVAWESAVTGRTADCPSERKGAYDGHLPPSVAALHRIGPPDRLT